MGRVIGKILFGTTRTLTLVAAALLLLQFTPSSAASQATGVHPSTTNQDTGNVLWVDADKGSDENSGTNQQDAFKTIQAGMDNAYPGVEIRIAPGIYRETIKPTSSGTAAEPVTLVSDQGRSTVFIRGSETSGSLTWTRLMKNSIGLPDIVDLENIYVADLSSWNLEEAPRFIVSTDQDGRIISRLMPAREPDYRVDTSWKFNEFWWSANGGTTVAECDPARNLNKDCDLSSRSYLTLTDTQDDNAPAGIEPGNLTSFGNLTGATLVAMDAHHAHYIYRRTIVSSHPKSGQVTVDSDCNNDDEPGLGWGSKYYVENHPALLDQPGEWYFDKDTGMLYLWAPSGQDPALLNLEISRLDTGFDLSNNSYIHLVDLTIELYNQNAYQIVNRGKTSAALGNQVSGCRIRYADRGVVLYHYVQGTDNQLAIENFTLEDSEIAYLDTTGFDSYFGWTDAPSPGSFTYAGVRSLLIRNNEFHHLGFNSSDRSAVGVRIFYPDNLRFEDNHVHHVAQNGVHLHLSLIVSDKTYNFTPDEIKLGSILILDNIIEKTCQAASDCGALKIGGSSRPDTHVFKDTLVMGNTFRHVFGWSYVSIQRRLNDVGDGNGFYLDYASGVHVYRNIAYNNSGAGFKLSCLWRDGDAVFFNNIAANNHLYGIKTTGMDSCDNHQGSVNTRFVNNILVYNGLAGFEILSVEGEYGYLQIDYNLYWNNGWDKTAGGTKADILVFRGMLNNLTLRGVEKIQRSTDWEEHGLAADPGYPGPGTQEPGWYRYPSLTSMPAGGKSSLLDSGSADLPESLTRILDLFGITEQACGAAWDIGRYEVCP